MERNPEPSPEELSIDRRIIQIAWTVIAILTVFLMGLGGSYLKWGQETTSSFTQAKSFSPLYDQVNPKNGYALPVSYGDLGPRLLEAGVIGYDAFAAIYENAGNPLTPEQIEILRNGSDQKIIIDAGNAHFLLNFFWAVGLANRNTILTEGPMVQSGDGQVERFASTGGWTLATRPVSELYASLELIPLTAAQQRLVEGVAAGIYRPCCDNHTLFPDCNHGMAMLGILELMASQGASADEMFAAAKYVNAFWFPQQMLETALYLQANQEIDFKDADPRLVVGERFSSASGSSRVHAELQAKGLLQQAPDQGSSCAN